MIRPPGSQRIGAVASGLGKTRMKLTSSQSQPIQGCEQSERFLCSISEATRLLGVGRTKLYDMLAKRQLTSIQIGTRRLVTMESIKALLDRAMRGAA